MPLTNRRPSATARTCRHRHSLFEAGPCGSRHPLQCDHRQQTEEDRKDRAVRVAAKIDEPRVDCNEERQRHRHRAAQTVPQQPGQPYKRRPADGRCSACPGITATHQPEESQMQRIEQRTGRLYHGGCGQSNRLQPGRPRRPGLNRRKRCSSKTKKAQPGAESQNNSIGQRFQRNTRFGSRFDS